MPGFVIVVDMQRDFVDAAGALPVPGAEAIVAPMQEWLATLKPAEVAGILLTFDTHQPEIYALSAEAEQFPIHCQRETAGWESVLDTSVVAPEIPLHVLEKGVFDMWAEPHLTIHSGDGTGTDRDAFFEQLAAAGISSVTVVGVASDFCVRWAAEGLVKRGFAVQVRRSLTRGIERPVEAVFGQSREVTVAP